MWSVCGGADYRLRARGGTAPDRCRTNVAGLAMVRPLRRVGSATAPRYMWSVRRGADRRLPAGRGTGPGRCLPNATGRAMLHPLGRVDAGTAPRYMSSLRGCADHRPHPPRHQARPVPCQRRRPRRAPLASPRRFRHRTTLYVVPARLCRSQAPPAAAPGPARAVPTSPAAPCCPRSGASVPALHHVICRPCAAVPITGPHPPRQRARPVPCQRRQPRRAPLASPRRFRHHRTTTGTSARWQALYVVPARLRRSQPPARATRGSASAMPAAPAAPCFPTAAPGSGCRARCRCMEGRCHARAAPLARPRGLLRRRPVAGHALARLPRPRQLRPGPCGKRCL